ncbi:hypothetical protein MTR_6g021700 [Medicago truncatula]|uniref:Uncharacterized protein n=1 Tax=Medicago truncatula TaxID=3880 RepID=G7KN53_MEDTR|nr:hypothetical protein MTR_6g021700 [Medicago truncatula]
MSSQANEEPTQAGANTTQGEANATQEEETQVEPIVGRKRKKTSVIWKDFDEKEITNGSSTSQMKRHLVSCTAKKLQDATEKRQAAIPFKRVSSGNPFLTSGVGYSN